MTNLLISHRPYFFFIISSYRSFSIIYIFKRVEKEEPLNFNFVIESILYIFLFSRCLEECKRKANTMWSLNAHKGFTIKLCGHKVLGSLRQIWRKWKRKDFIRSNILWCTVCFLLFVCLFSCLFGIESLSVLSPPPYTRLKEKLILV